MLKEFKSRWIAACACAVGAAVAALPGTALGQAATAPGVAVQGAQGLEALEGLPILRVVVEGNTRTPTALVLDQVRAQPGQPFSQALVAVDLNAIASLDRFVTARAEVEHVQTATSNGVVVHFIVEERALVTAVEIVGNRKIADDQLRAGLTIRKGGAIDPFRIEVDRKYILDLYKKEGYAQASVDVDAKALAQEGIVRYQIIEGPISQIADIQIEGNANLSDDYIKWRIQTKTYFWIFRKGLLDEAKLQADVATIRDMYQQKGYLDVRVSSALDYSEDKSKLTVRFIVIEGPQYKIGKVNLTGNDIFSRGELLGEPPRMGPGSIAERDKIDALQRRIQDVYDHEGYIFRTVEITTSYTDTPGVKDLNINITEGKSYKVGRVIVRGNGGVQDKVIRRQVRIYPDQTFDMVQVRKSIERLKAVRLFGDVKVTPITSPGNPEGVQDALVEVQEGLTGSYSIGAGVSTNSGLVGQLSLEQRNFDITNPPRSWDEFFRGQGFKGAGQYFQILLEPGTEFQRYQVKFEEPFLFDTQYSFSNSAYFFTRARESWDERRIGDLMTFGRRFGDVWGVSVGVRAEDVTISKPQDVFSNGITETNVVLTGPNGTTTRFNDTAQEILNEKGSHFLTSIKPAVVRDTTDSQSFPTAGTHTSLSLEQYGALGGDVDMTKIVLDFNWYQTVYTDLFDRKTVFSLRNEVGVIPVGTSPTYERFYLGGIGQMRGFRFRGISPRSGPLHDPIGGDFSWVTTGELNFPIYENFLRGVVFVDVGTVDPDVSVSHIRLDTGAGVRLSLPFLGGLPLALDFAFPALKQSGDRTQFLSVSLGVPF